MIMCVWILEIATCRFRVSFSCQMLDEMSTENGVLLDDYLSRQRDEMEFWRIEFFPFSFHVGIERPD